MGADNIANGSAALEPDFSANTINTTWYSNGEQLTGNNIPATCTYDNALIPPTPADRPGYTFGGWKIRIQCNIPSTDVSNGANAYAAKKLSGGTDNTNGGATAATYGITQPGEWGVSWSNGDKVTGVALCSAHSGSNHGYQWGGNSSDWTSDETTLTSATGETLNCWCKATHYTANNAQQCSLSSPAWVFFGDRSSADSCANYCAYFCANSRNYPDFRLAVLGSYVAQ